MHAAERQSLLAQLAHADDELRRLAVERTSLLPADEAIPLLVERLGDPSWRVRKAAVERLGALPERASAVGPLLGAIADGGDAGRRNAALEALVACGRLAVPGLVDALGSPDVDVRKQAVDVLGTIGDARAEPALERSLADADANVRAAAADALATLGAGTGAGALLARAADDPEPLVRLAALRALVRLEAPVPFATIESALADPTLAAAGYAALGQCGDAAALDAILKGLVARRASLRDAASRAATCAVARACAGDADALAERVRDFAAAHPEIAREAAERLCAARAEERLERIQFAALLRAPETAHALIQAGTDSAAAPAARDALGRLGPLLVRALADAWPRLSPVERAFACSALVGGDAFAGAESMLRTALLDASAEVRAAAARAIAECASAPVLGALFSRLEHDDERAAQDAAEDETDALIAAIVRLAERDGSEAVDAAIELVEARLLRGGARARLAGARLLAQLARRADVARVQSLLSDANAAVRRKAVDAIARLGAGGEELLHVALADEAPSVRAACAAVVAQLGAASADEDLATLAQDRDERVRVATMSALAQRAQQPSAREHCFGLLLAGLRGGGVEALAALSSLQRIGGPEAAAIAARALPSSEPELVERAAACIGAHGGPALRGELIELLSHAAWPVRARAARELAAQRAAAAVPKLHERLAVERDEFVREALLAALASLEA
jgi:HEAT repeat protein